MFRAKKDDPLAAVFDDTGFFLSDESNEEYQKMDKKTKSSKKLIPLRNTIIKYELPYEQESEYSSNQ